jgi:hypothetical protein
MDSYQFDMVVKQLETIAALLEDMNRKIPEPHTLPTPRGE